MKRSGPSKPVSAGSLVDGVLEGLGLRRGLSRHSVVQLWPKIVDTTVARHTKCEKLVDSTLYVLVDSSVWMNELAALKRVLLDKVNGCLEPGTPKITDIRFQQRSWAKSADETQESPAPDAPPTEENKRMVRRALEPVKDEHLKKALERILEKDRVLKSRREIKE